jgi:hypothetical protein
MVGIPDPVEAFRAIATALWRGTEKRRSDLRPGRRGRRRSGEGCRSFEEARADGEGFFHRVRVAREVEKARCGFDREAW